MVSPFYLTQIFLAYSLNRKCKTGKFVQSKDLICGKNNSNSNIKYLYIEIPLLFSRTPSYRIQTSCLSADRVYYLLAGLLAK